MISIVVAMSKIIGRVSRIGKNSFGEQKSNQDILYLKQI